MLPIPSVGTILATSTEAVSSLVTYVTPLLVLVIGLIAGGVIVLAIKKGVVRGITKLAGGRRRGGRRRR